MLSRLKSYFQESRKELKKVSWAPKEQVFRLTLVVIVISLSVAFFLGIIDVGFEYLLSKLLHI